MSIYEPVLGAVHGVVTEEDKLALLAPFTLEEFQATLFLMNPDKALGPNRFNPSFY